MSEKVRNSIDSSSTLTKSARVNLKLPEKRRTMREADSDVYNSAKKKKLSQSLYASNQSLYQVEASTEKRMTLLRTPGKGPSSGSDLNRKACAENVQKIIRVLQRHAPFYKRLNLNASNGLKSMSAKQFIDIIAHFISIISGRTINTNRPGDSETDILNFIKSLNYLYPVNKSWLKTPNAPHAYHECVALLAWMSDLTGEADDEIEASMDAYYSNERCNDFPSVAYTKLFSKEIRNGFQMWIRQDDESYERWIEQLVSKHVIASMSDCVQNMDEFDGTVAAMRKSIDDLKQQDNSIHNETYFDEMVTRTRHYETLATTLENSIAVKSQKLAGLVLVARDKQHSINAQQKIIDEKQKIIAKQPSTIDEWHALKEKRLELEQAIAYLRTEIQTFQDDTAAQQLQMARLTQQKSETIAKLNRLGFRLTQIILTSKSGSSIETAGVHVDPNASNDAIRQTCRNIDSLIKAIQSRKLKIGFSIEPAKTQLKKLIMLDERHADKGATQSKAYQELNKRLRVATELLLQQRDAYETTICGLQEQLKRVTDKGNAMVEEMKAAVQRVAQLKEDNQRIFADGERQAAEILEIKTKLIGNLDAALEHIGRIKSEEHI